MAYKEQVILNTIVALCVLRHNHIQGFVFPDVSNFAQE